MTTLLTNTQIANKLVECTNASDNDAFRGIFMQYLNINNFDQIHKKYFKILSESRKRYVYLVTFTLKPEYHNKPEWYDEARKYINTLPDRPALKILKSETREELTKANIPHWHMACLTSIPLAKSRFIWWTQKFGFIDVSKTKDKSLTTDQAFEKVLEYTTKED